MAQPAVAGTYDPPIATFLAHITVRPGHEAAFEQAARRLWHRSHADEPELVRYEYWRGAEPRTYSTMASFRSYDAFIAHQVSDHHLAALPELRATIESIRIEWVDPVAGASDLAPTEPGTADAHDTELVADYRRRYPLDMPDWWLALR